MESRPSQQSAPALKPSRPKNVATQRSEPPKPEEPSPKEASRKPDPPVTAPHPKAKPATVATDDAEQPAHPVSNAWAEFSRGNPDSPKIALTFDAGWENRPGPKILDVLAKHNIHSTFFLTGMWVEKNQNLTRRIIAEGHEIGNHTWSHKRLTKLSASEIEAEADKAEQLIIKITGRSAKPLLRIPYGERDKRVLSVLAKLGYRSIYWDEDCLDSVKPNVTSDEIEERVMRKTRNGSVVLMHIGSDATANALDSILQKLQVAGFQPVTVGELLNN